LLVSAGGFVAFFAAETIAAQFVGKPFSFPRFTCLGIWQTVIKQGSEGLCTTLAPLFVIQEKSFMKIVIRRPKLPIIIFGLFLCLGWFAWLLFSKPAQEPEPVTEYELSAEKVVKIDLPAMAEFSAQIDDNILFMSTVWSSGVSPLEVISFSTKTQQERWRVELPAPPLHAIRFKNSYLIATSNGPGQSGHILALDSNTGKIIWDLPLGDSFTALASDDERVWIVGEKSLVQINPETGQEINQISSWNGSSGLGVWRTLIYYTENGRDHLVVSVGKDIFYYAFDGATWAEIWRFHASSSPIELQPVSWASGEGKHILVMAQSVIYDIKADGTTSWRLDNNDVNRQAYSIRCGNGETCVVFRNIMSGVYLVDRNGLRKNWELPGGSARIGKIPLPVPANPALGLSVADVNNDGVDEIFVNSMTRIFVFDVNANLLAVSSLLNDAGAAYVTQLRDSPHYPPFVFNQQIVIAGQNQLKYFSFQKK